MNCTIKCLFLSRYDRVQTLQMYACDAHCIWAVPSCLASFILLSGKDLDPLLRSSRKWKHKGVAVPACPSPPLWQQLRVLWWMMPCWTLPAFSWEHERERRTAGQKSLSAPGSQCLWHISINKEIVLIESHTQKYCSPLMGSHSMWYMNPGSEPTASKEEQVYRAAARNTANKLREGRQKTPI